MKGKRVNVLVCMCSLIVFSIANSPVCFAEAPPLEMERRDDVLPEIDTTHPKTNIVESSPFATLSDNRSDNKIGYVIQANGYSEIDVTDQLEITIGYQFFESILFLFIRF